MKFNDLDIRPTTSVVATLLSLTDGVAKLQLAKDVMMSSSVSGDTSQLTELIGKKITITGTGTGQHDVAIATVKNKPVRKGDGCATGARNVRLDTEHF